MHLDTSMRKSFFNLESFGERAGKHSVSRGDLTSVVFSEPLHGGSPDEWLTELAEMGDRFQDSPFPQLRQAKVPPQGFSEDRTSPSACMSFSTLDSEAVKKSKTSKK